MADMPKVSITKLNNDNYQIWKYKMELLLIREELWTVINTPKPEEAQQAQIWQKKDDKARATLGLFVEDAQIIHVRKKTTAKEVWDSLKNYHEKSTLTSKIYLLRQICELKLSEGGDMEDHIVKMENLVDNLTALGEELKDHLVVAMLLSSLPESYGILITALESRPEKELTLSLMKGKLIDEFKRRKGVEGSGDTALKVGQNSGIKRIKRKRLLHRKLMKKISPLVNKVYWNQIHHLFMIQMRHMNTMEIKMVYRKFK